ncbi:AAA family ATPase, partial [Patescibacteria group bacterium]|nr:AAA family ATPase [Patescibacteria group bacterium]MBU1613007.1 AAA family ATPase [Patescibacteria group bacterium]
ENRFGVASFLPLNKIKGRPVYNDMEQLLRDPNVLGLAQDFIKFDGKFNEIFSFIFGNTVVVRDLRAAEAVGIGRARMVTLSGDLAERNGMMRGGFRQKRNNLSFSSKLSLNGEDRMTEYQAQINLEQHHLNELDRKIDEAKTKMIELQVQSQSATARSGMLAEENNKSQNELINLERELAIAQSSPEEYGAELQKIASEKENKTKEFEKQEKKVVEIGREVSEFNEREEVKKRRVFALQTEMQEKQEEVNKILAERNDLKIQSAKLETKLEDLVQEVYNEMNTALSGIMERNPIIVDVEMLEGLVSDIQKLKYQLSLIGGIDEEVTDEYKTTKERFDFLTGQLDDLNKATTDLEKTIEELDESMKKKRAAAFKKIRKEFDRYFKILFGGGSVSLEEIYGEAPEEHELLGEVLIQSGSDGSGLAEPEEGKKRQRREKILTGIEIVVNPPGKKIKHINALSGGERTLTSIALICAILNCNPSPFVVLDEVEAALDEANTARFVRIMSELSTQSQFIIITHNRVTMHAADALYGVTMGGDGVSKLLSVKIQEAVKYNEDDGQDIDKNA